MSHQPTPGQSPFHIELVPPKHDAEALEDDLEAFRQKYLRVLDGGRVVCITDNAMGRLAFQGHELIDELGLPVPRGQVSLHLTTFHTLPHLHEILDACLRFGLRDLLVVSGDGSDRLPRLLPRDLGEPGVEAVTSVELTRYIHQRYPGAFATGVAFNPYEPPEHEFEKLERKLGAGASFAITQPILARHAVVDGLMEKYPSLPVFVEAWMSRNLSLLSGAVGYTIPEGTPFDPVAALAELQRMYPRCGYYLSLVGFKTQYHLLEGMDRREATA